MKRKPYLGNIECNCRIFNERAIFNPGLSTFLAFGIIYGTIYVLFAIKMLKIKKNS